MTSGERHDRYTRPEDRPDDRGLQQRPDVTDRREEGPHADVPPDLEADTATEGGEWTDEPGPDAQHREIAGHRVGAPVEVVPARGPERAPTTGGRVPRHHDPEEDRQRWEGGEPTG